MAGILLVAEHREGRVSEGTLELATLARELGERAGVQTSALVIGHGVAAPVEALSRRVPRVLVVEDERLAAFRWETHAAVTRDVLARESPLLTLCPHSAFGMELLPRLSVEVGLPCVTDCIELTLEGSCVSAVRSIHNGKVRSAVALAPAGGYLATIRAGIRAPAEEGAAGAVERVPCPPLEGPFRTEHLGYREEAAGEVDIAQAPLLLAIGRGIKDADNLPAAQELADRLGAVLACSRPVVDKGWLGKERQVGTSGRTVKPRAYLALGISGAFQHLAGIKGSGVLIAVNRDPKAPIFAAANYGVVADLFKIMDALKTQSGS